MALSKPIGAAASVAGIVAGVTTILAALGDADTSACIAKVASALGPHAGAIGTAIVGLIAGVGPIVAWYSHGPVPLSTRQQIDDQVKHGITP